MPFLSITKIPARCCAGQSEYITIGNECMRIFTFWSGDLWSHDLNTSLSVFLVPNWSISNNINVKCSRKLVYVISNDRIWFSYIHLRFQLFCLCVCLWIYSVGFFSSEKCRFLISLIWLLHIRSCYKFQIRLQQNQISFLFLNRTA